jgi:membrane dipeptidase
MKFIDFHCDTLMHAFFKKTTDIYDDPAAMLDIVRMRGAGQLAQFFAIFMPPPRMPEHFGLKEPLVDAEYIAYCLDVFAATAERHSDVFAPAYTAADILRNEADGKTSGLLTFEDGRAIDGKLENLEYYFQKGIRLISLTWNGENCFGYPNSADAGEMARGLKPFGKDAVRRMNELGIIVDVSHLSDGGFYDVAALSAKPFVASHSNSRTLSPHRRNLTDDMVRTLANHGGIAGLNFAGAFLNADITDNDSTLERISAHIRKLIELGGEDVAALGSDFDGIHGNLEISGVEKVPLIFDRLQQDGLSAAVIEKVAWRNAQRVIRDTLG